MKLRSYICPFCGYNVDSIIPLVKCPSCDQWLVPPSQRTHEYPPMEYIAKKTISNCIYCEDCGSYQKFVGVYDPPCPDCSEYEYHKQREHLVFQVEKALKDALQYSESENPDMKLLKKKIKFAYDWYRKYGLADYEEDEDEWMDELYGPGTDSLE